MGTLKRGSVAVALGGVLVVGLTVLALAHGSAGLDVAQAQGSAIEFYNVGTAELAIPAEPGGNLQADAVCRPGDVAVGGGHIVHPSGTIGMFVTKSYATDRTGAFKPPYTADRWRAKVVHADSLGAASTEKLTVHAVCAKLTP